VHKVLKAIRVVHKVLLAPRVHKVQSVHKVRKGFKVQ
jgi:hypothetical protein